MSFESKLKTAKTKKDRLNENSDYVFNSFNHLNNLITGNKTIALLAGTAVPVSGPNSSEKRKFDSLFYYFSHTQVYSVLDLINEKLNISDKPTFRTVVQNIRKNKLSINTLYEKLKGNIISFIDTLSQFETNEDYEYSDDELLDYRLDYEAFKNLKNVKIIFANSQNAEKALATIVEKLSLNIKIVPIYIFSYGITNEEIASKIAKELKEIID